MRVTIRHHDHHKRYEVSTMRCLLMYTPHTMLACTVCFVADSTLASKTPAEKVSNESRGPDPSQEQCLRGGYHAYTSPGTRHRCLIATARWHRTYGRPRSIRLIRWSGCLTGWPPLV